MLSETEMRPLALAIAVLVLSIMAIAAFVMTGGSAAFYIIVAIALIAGFYMAYYVSRAETAPKPSKRTRKSAR
jgi:peptidoglycan/LPS O-acetylase OafA/YrhL